MVKNHLKRLATPKTWDIKRKESQFVVKPAAGGSKLEHTLPLALILRDILKRAKTVKEVKYILLNKQILINGTRVREHNAPVTLMDVISIPEINEFYRLVITIRGKLALVKIDSEESKILLMKIKNKTLIKGGKMQLNFSSGNNVIVDKNDYSTGDVIVFSAGLNSPNGHLKLEKGAVIYLTGGRHIGEVGKLEDMKGNNFLIKTPKNDIFETSKEYAFVIGKEKPIIKLAD